MSEVPKRLMRARAVAIFGRRATRAVARITLGVGMVALVLSERYTGTRYTTAWGIIGWAGFILVVASLPSVIYDVYLRYLRNRRTARSGDARRVAAECTDRVQPFPNEE